MAVLRLVGLSFASKKLLKKKKVGTMRAAQRENNGFAEEVFLDSHTHSGVM